MLNEQRKAAEGDAECAPNTVTYSSVISACERGGRLDKALEMYNEMLGLGIEPDLITYSAMVAACEKHGALDKALEVLVRMTGFCFSY